MGKDALLFQLLRMGLEIDLTMQFAFSNHSDIDIDVDFAIKHGVGAFVFDGLQKAIEAGTLTSDAVAREVKMKLYSHTIQVEKQCEVQYAKAAELSSLFAADGIRVVVLKGIAAGMNYPNLWHRPCGDFDCYLMGDYDKGNEIAKMVGAEVGLHSYKHSHINYKGLMVENHQFCTAHRGSKRMKRFERCLQKLLKEEGCSRIGNTCIECPSPLFNAIYLTHHAKEHFISEGISLRHLCDWAMLLHKHAEEIDWQRFMLMANEYGLRKFADAMTWLAIEYLNVSVPQGCKIIFNEACVRTLESALKDGVISEDSGNFRIFRINKVRRFMHNNERLKLFSNTHFISYVARQAMGLLFDRNPKI